MTEKKTRGGARPGSGPKKKYATGRARSVSLHVYLSEDEARYLACLCVVTGVNRTDFVRRAILDALKK